MNNFFGGLETLILSSIMNDMLRAVFSYVRFVLFRTRHLLSIQFFYNLVGDIYFFI